MDREPPRARIPREARRTSGPMAAAYFSCSRIAASLLQMPLHRPSARTLCRPRGPAFSRTPGRAPTSHCTCAGPCWTARQHAVCSQWARARADGATSPSQMLLDAPTSTLGILRHLPRARRAARRGLAPRRTRHAELVHGIVQESHAARRRPGGRSASFGAPKAESRPVCRLWLLLWLAWARRPLIGCCTMATAAKRIERGKSDEQKDGQKERRRLQRLPGQGSLPSVLPDAARA